MAKVTGGHNKSPGIRMKMRLERCKDAARVDLCLISWPKRRPDHLRSLIDPSKGAGPVNPPPLLTFHVEIVIRAHATPCHIMQMIALQRCLEKGTARYGNSLTSVASVLTDAAMLLPFQRHINPIACLL